MGLYLYCVGRSDHPDPGPQTGIDGAAVRSPEVAGYRVWLSALPASPAASLDRVRSHHAVIERCCAPATLLPMRFGQWFDTEDGLAAALEGRRARLDRGLERVRDAVEFGIRVIDPGFPASAEVPDRSSGRAYLEALARREREATARERRGATVAVALERHLGSCIRAQCARFMTSGALVAAAHLISRHDTGTYRERVRTFEESRPDLRFALSGPWPPYGFVDDEG
ncbi:MAG: hypothetical protein GWN71_31780, partial [Gammaproteobacteria bacterium]|nr:GvpL/GvpF family gas vesicle protein [Gemmatimonadota bacterium]NIU77968.1 hypothetical protein [Gammaproteobacteria bacterium]NIY11419.1 hypothetical protein [Gemmatimonadota bacterium]